MRGHGRPVRRTLAPRLVLTTLVVVALTAGCTGSDDPADDPAPSSSALSDIDLTGVVGSREAFCDDLDADDVEELLGGEPSRTSSYDAGQRAELTSGLRDVANEFSCYFERGSGTTSQTARAWLFAQPVSPEQAREWIKEREGDERCEAAGELTFGEPGLVQSCSQESRRRVTAVGLFGDAWLTCQATGPSSDDADELLEQTQRWCAEVALTTSG